jgi:hypothetical protein
VEPISRQEFFGVTSAEFWDRTGLWKDARLTESWDTDAIVSTKSWSRRERRVAVGEWRGRA